MSHDPDLERDLRVERVLRTVEQLPPGRVAAYGQVGAIAGVGARHVGRILRDWGADVPWWRVVAADGTVAPPLRDAAFAHWEHEGIPVRPDGAGCRPREVGADLHALREAARRAWADLPQDPG
ncbi:MGMT family protein [Brachybacterium sp. EF45031]|uniref:MGMT family protein n=1 Tax=Brachybacterium sillae TaxID=2810536 RepID=UPI00217DFFAA|nr:MGMT family protein [Brachybacterium sillae]MCS6712106.1 MGMT family protein [Brachybacterium sillae]